jgi:hypothetical protein
MSRRTFLRQVFAVLAGPAVLAAAGCGAGRGVEKPVAYSGPPPAAPAVKSRARVDRGVPNVKTE